jgi:hypothetical protein
VPTHPVVNHLRPTDTESLRDLGRPNEIVQINPSAHVPTVTRWADTGWTLLRIYLRS